MDPITITLTARAEDLADVSKRIRSLADEAIRPAVISYRATLGQDTREDADVMRREAIEEGTDPAKVERVIAAMERASSPAEIEAAYDRYCRLDHLWRSIAEQVGGPRVSAPPTRRSFANRVEADAINEDRVTGQEIRRSYAHDALRAWVKRGEGAA